MARVRQDIRILLVTPRFFPVTGGVEAHVAQVSRRYAERGAAVTVLTADPGGKYAPEDTVNGVSVCRVRAWPSDRDYYFAPGIAQVITTGGWDIVHLQSYHTLVAPIAMLAALQARIPYVVTFHGGGHSSPLRTMLRRPQLALLRPLLARAARLIATATFEIDHFGRILRLPPARFVLIPNGGDLPQTAEVAVDPSLIIAVGRVEQYKGHQHLIAALPYVLAERPDVRVRIVGSGPYEGELRALALRLGVADRVTIAGVPLNERGAMAELVQRAALMTLLSDYETHPMAALESIALRRPVLVANNSGLRELAERGLARAVSNPRKPRETAAAILRQLRDPLIPTGIVLPTWDACTNALLELYHEIIATTGGFPQQDGAPCVS
jgi:glycosyltransferase involved in cell wall biosynthesis